jgi:tripartite-type tricarboxylate transporter receptor subunit TctC
MCAQGLGIAGDDREAVIWYRRAAEQGDPIGQSSLGRMFAERMKVSLGQSVIVENVSGAGGSIGVGRVARSAPDGYTLSLGTVSTHVLNGPVYPVQYDVLKDLEPVALISAEPLLIVSRRDLPATTLRELISWLKANPDKASSGHPGVGTAPHMANVVFQKQTGTRFQLIPYRGTGPSMQDLVAGQIDMEIDPTSNSLPQVRAGRIRAYAVAANTRLNAAPEIPTVEEAGLPGFHASLWYGLWATKGTPKDVIGKPYVVWRESPFQVTHLGGYLKCGTLQVLVSPDRL